MTQCRAVNQSGKQCKREALNRSQYCWQHTPKFTITLSVVVVFFLSIIGIWGDFIDIGLLNPLSQKTPSEELDTRIQLFTELTQKGTTSL